MPEVEIVMTLNDKRTRPARGALDAAIEEQSLLQKELKSTEAEIKLNNKAYEALEKSAIDAAKGIREVERKSESAAHGIKEDARTVKESMGSGDGILKKLRDSELSKMIGAVTGGLQGLTAIEQVRDDSFKFYVQEGVEGQLAEMDSIRAAGSATAGQREQDQIAFAQRFGSAEDTLGVLQTLSDATAGLNLDSSGVSMFILIYKNIYPEMFL